MLRTASLWLEGVFSKEVRARPGGPGLLYRFVDEYETEFLMPFDRSEAPLSMGELIRVIDGSVGMREKPGQVWSVLDANYGRGNQWGEEPRRVARDRPQVRHRELGVLEEWSGAFSRTAGSLELIT